MQETAMMNEPQAGVAGRALIRVALSNLGQHRFGFLGFGVRFGGVAAKIAAIWWDCQLTYM